MAAYFPRGQQTFADIKKKFEADLVGVAANKAVGIAFVTNQEMRLAERSELYASAKASSAQSEIYHLESVAAILDTPGLNGFQTLFKLGHFVFDAFDNIGLIIIDVQKLFPDRKHRGGSTFCYAMLYDFDIDKRPGQA